MKFLLHCDMLVDQGRIINGVRMGYKCGNPAVEERPSGYLLCNLCRHILETQPDRLSFPTTHFGREYQESIIKDIYKGMIETVETVVAPDVVLPVGPPIG